MGEAWRIVKARHAATAFTGEGAAKTGGRWNSRGVFVIYTSGTKSLATLESLVHLNPPLTFNYVAFRLRFDESLVGIFNIKNLPADWRDEPPPPSTKALGDTWVKAARSPVLALPSVITGETNYLLNPAHPDFKKISIGRAKPFVFDPRLLAGKP
jgi:RES domain-containing protein